MPKSKIIKHVADLTMTESEALKHVVRGFEDWVSEYRDIARIEDTRIDDKAIEILKRSQMWNDVDPPYSTSAYDLSPPPRKK